VRTAIVADKIQKKYIYPILIFLIDLKSLPTFPYTLKIHLFWNNGIYLNKYNINILHKYIIFIKMVKQ